MVGDETGGDEEGKSSVFGSGVFEQLERRAISGTIRIGDETGGDEAEKHLHLTLECLSNLTEEPSQEKYDIEY